MNKVKSIKIGRQMVGPEQPTYIIAEAGVNHNGDVGRAKELIDLAAEAGADVIKFQTFSAENIVTRSADRAKYQKKNMPKIDETQWQMLKKLELDKKAFLQLKKYADSKGILFLSTPYDEGSIDLLFDIGVAAFKVSSAWITNLPFLRHMAKKGLPIIFSRGMSYKDEVEEAIQTLKEAGNDQLILLHCHFNYPTDFKDINLNMIKTIKNEFGLVTGFSDHTLGITAPIAAVALGAQVIEKHFTLDKSLPGPDHKASLNPDELKAMIKGIREVEQALGTAKITVTKNETPMRKVSRTSLVSVTNIKAGTVITEKMVGIKRPGTGIRPRHYEDIIGKTVIVDIPADSVIEVNAVKGLSDIKDLKVGNKTQEI